MVALKTFCEQSAIGAFGLPMAEREDCEQGEICLFLLLRRSPFLFLFYHLVLLRLDCIRCCTLLLLLSIHSHHSRHFYEATTVNYVGSNFFLLLDLFSTDLTKLDYPPDVDMQGNVSMADDDREERPVSSS